MATVSANVGIKETGWNVVPPTKSIDASVSVFYNDGTATGSTIIQDVTVTMNGTTIPYVPVTGGYDLIYNKSINAGSTIAVSVITSHGNFSASGVLPAVSGTQVHGRFQRNMH